MTEITTDQAPALVAETPPAPRHETRVTDYLPEFGMTMLQMASTLAQSGMFGKGLTPQQACAKMLIGRELGLDPISSIQNIDVFDGNIFLRANLRAAKIKSTPGYDYRIAEHTDTSCSVEFTVGGRSVGLSTYTLADAKRAGLIKPGGAWEKSPRNMLFARALSNGQRWYMPELMGGRIVYDADTERDEIIAASEPAPVATAPLREKLAAKAGRALPPAPSPGEIADPFDVTEADGDTPVIAAEPKGDQLFDNDGE